MVTYTHEVTKDIQWFCFVLFKNTNYFLCINKFGPKHVWSCEVFDGKNKWKKSNKHTEEEE